MIKALRKYITENPIMQTELKEEGVSQGFLLDYLDVNIDDLTLPMDKSRGFLVHPAR